MYLFRLLRMGIETEPPQDPIDRIRWVRQKRAALDQQLARALFDARLQGRFEEAREAAQLARKPALALTRQVNEGLGRQIRWGTN